MSLIRGLRGVAACLKCSSRTGVTSSTALPFSGSKSSRLVDCYGATSLIESATGHCERHDEIEIPITQDVFYRTVKVDELLIFYREAGPKNAPAIPMLDGLPARSRTVEALPGGSNVDFRTTLAHSDRIEALIVLEPWSQ